MRSKVFKDTDMTDSSKFGMQRICALSPCRLFCSYPLCCYSLQAREVQPADLSIKSDAGAELLLVLFVVSVFPSASFQSGPAPVRLSFRSPKMSDEQAAVSINENS